MFLDTSKYLYCENLIFNFIYNEIMYKCRKNLLRVKQTLEEISFSILREMCFAKEV